MTTTDTTAYVIGKRTRVSWSRWDAVRMRNVTTHPMMWPVTGADEPERLFDTKREAQEWIDQMAVDVDAAQASAPADPPATWGTAYGSSAAYVTPDGPVWMRRKGQRVRFVDESGAQVGPEQANVAPAVAYALATGWSAPESATQVSADLEPADCPEVDPASGARCELAPHDTGACVADAPDGLHVWPSRLPCPLAASERAAQVSAPDVYADTYRPLYAAAIAAGASKADAAADAGQAAARAWVAAADAGSLAPALEDVSTWAAPDPAERHA